jgi:hypothetical protein
MQLGMIGLGRTGANMVRRLIGGGHECVVFDMSPKAVEAFVKEKAVGASSLADFVKRLSKPRARWMPRRRRCATPSTTSTTCTSPALPRSGGVRTWLGDHGITLKPRITQYYPWRGGRASTRNPGAS